MNYSDAKPEQDSKGAKFEMVHRHVFEATNKTDQIDELLKILLIL